MSTNVLTAILDRHGVPYMIQDNRILADSMEAGVPLFADTIDVTNYNRGQLLAWLGY
jgi:hypothetical protein